METSTLIMDYAKKEEIVLFYKNLIREKHGFLNFAAFSQITNEAPPRSLNVPLVDIFLPFDFSFYQNQDKKEISSSDMLSDFKNKIILAGPGYGKTTFLKFALLNIFKQNEIPVYWEWKKIYLQIGDNTTFRSLLIDYFKALFINKFNAEEIESFIQRHDFIFLIDGFDEVASSDHIQLFKSLIKNYKEIYPKNYFVIASRIANYPLEYIESLSEIGFEHYKINPLQEHLIFQYINKFINFQFPDDKLKSAAKIEFLSKYIETQPGIKALAEHPLLLNLIVLIYAFEGSLPDTKVNLYNRCIELLIYVWKKSDKDIKVFSEFYLDTNLIKVLLTEVAYEYFEKFVEGEVKEFGALTNAEMKETISNAYINLMHQEIQESEVEKVIESLFNYFKNDTGLIVEISPECFGFSHLTLFEYLTAQHIVRKCGDFNSNLEYIIKILKNTRFKKVEEVIIFQIELLGKSTSNYRFIDILAKRLLSIYKKQNDYNILILLAKLLKDDQNFSIYHTKEILKLLTLYRAKHPNDNEIASLIHNIFLFSEKSRTYFVELLSKSAKEIEIWENFSQRTAHRIGNKIFSIRSDLNIIEKENKKIKNDITYKIEQKISKIKDQINTINMILSEYRDFAFEINSDTEEHNIDSMLREIIKRLRKVYPDVRIAYFSRFKDIFAFTDKSRIEQVLEELTENSIKYAEVLNLRIAISLNPMGSSYLVHFKNNGVGIQKKIKTKIFEPFFSTDSKSTGIGLSNVKKIVESLDGEIEEIGNEKRGVHFKLTFNGGE